jgi:hypothetical protein
MDAISVSANTRPALNGADAQGANITALKLAAQSEQAVVKIVEEAAASAKAPAPEGQGRFVDRSV